MTIEPMVPERDLDGVVEVEEISFTNPWTREMYLKELENDRVAHVFVLRDDDGRVEGFCSLWVILDELHINNVAIRPEFRGQGWGLALLTQVLREGVRLGATRATLEVRRSNEAARGLYRRLGFEMVGMRRNYYSNPVEDALILWRENLASAFGSARRA
ncbi:MAG TPA: ribosomal protein S18-alanine N-acetyltransferase [Vicinamibacterales bacterium]|nr:ribosomal protein S18-alanine N-acetyltransferase [Vicinamibacterales bacterium]